MNRKEFKTKRLILRPLKKSDYKVWVDFYTQGLEKQNKWDFSPYKIEKCGRDVFEKVIKKHKELAKADDWYWYGIYLKKTGELIGHVDFDIFVRGSHQFANFGYLLQNRYWGQGYGREAAEIGLRIGFKELKLNRLEAAINLDHKKSIRLVKSIGMKREGIKKRYWFEDGHWVDHLIYVANPEDVGLKPMVSNV